MKVNDPLQNTLNELIKLSKNLNMFFVYTLKYAKIAIVCKY